MDVFREYKPIRNRIAALARDDALGVIWAYCKYLQIDNVKFPSEIEVARKYLESDFPQRFIAEWELELLAKEVILNSGLIASKGRTLRKWNTLNEIIGAIKNLENNIYGAFGSEGSILVELIRIAHRQFIWRTNRPNSATAIRYYKIFNRPLIDQICLERIGLNVWQIYMCGLAWMGAFLTHPATKAAFTSDIKILPKETLENFLSFTSKTVGVLKPALKSEQQYNENFAYAFNSLRAYPMVRMIYKGDDSFVCPLPTLLFWKFTAGLYYELIDDPRFPNEFGEGFQQYVGEVIDRACPQLQPFSEQTYLVGKQEKRTVDWIVADQQSALFLECKSKRLSLDAKISLTDMGPLETDIGSMAAAVVQVYKAVADYEKNLYPNFPKKDGRKIFLGVVTPENWHMFGPIMLNKLDEAVAAKARDAGLTSEWMKEKPYSIFAIEDLETGLQILNSVGIADFMDGKLGDAQMRQWDWHAYMGDARFKKYFPVKKLFEKEYDELTDKLLAAQTV